MPRVFTVTLLPLAPADGAHFSLLHGQVFPKAWSAAAFCEMFAVPGTFAFAAHEAGSSDMAGFILCRALYEQCEILTFVVSPSCRRAGAGWLLLHAAMQHAHGLGARSMLLEVGDDNAVARYLYEKAGFKTVGSRSRYYVSAGVPAVDAAVMRRELQV